MAVERPKPVVEQVNEILRERIRNKTYSPGERLPSESDFATDFQVSRATVRTVLARLEVEGLIIRKQGDGTFVNERLEDVNAHLGGLWEFTRLIESSGYLPSIQAGVTVQRAATEAEAAGLKIDVGGDVMSLQRVFLADDRPVIVANNTLAIDLLVNGTAAMDGSKPIRQFMADYCQREIAYATSDIRAILPDKFVAETLLRSASQPLLKLTIIFYDKNHTPLLFGISYFDDDVLKLRLVQAWS